MANNLIKVRQLDPEISGYITGVLADNFAGFAVLFGSSSGYLGPTVLYTTGGDQTVLGNVVFEEAPFIPYTGTSGQAVSLQFVLDQIGALESQYPSLTGNQTISGNKFFAGVVTTSSGIFISELLAPSPTSPSGVVNLEYFDSVAALLGATQTFTGINTFSLAPQVPVATGSGDAVQFFQFNQAVTNLTNEISEISTGNVSGFGGVLSINGASGRNFIRGCGGVSVIQQGNVTRISGQTITVEGGTMFLLQSSIPTGVNSYSISLSGLGFMSPPTIIGELTNNTGAPIYAHSISGITSSGFSVYFSDQIYSSGYVFNSLVGPSGVSLAALQGVPGPEGQSLTWQGTWNPTTIYSPLDYVLLSGASFLCAQSNSGFNPFTSPTYWNVALSGNGQQGPSGATGVPGEAAILFNWMGNWSPTTTYVSGSAVYLSGSAYGFTGSGPITGFGNSPYNNAGWSLVINGSGIDTSAFYPMTGNPSGFVGSAALAGYLTTGQSGLFMPYVSGQTFVSSINVTGDSLTGNIGMFGAGNVIVSVVGGQIMVSGFGSGSGSFGVGGGGLGYFGNWNQSAGYQSGAVVEFNNALYLYTGSSGISGPDLNPVSIGNPWTIFGTRNITHNEGSFDPNKIYYNNDLALVYDPNTYASVLYINTSPIHIPLLALNPESGYYNSFEDCNFLLGYNLLSVNIVAKDQNEPLLNSGYTGCFSLNGVTPNQSASGYGTLTMIRGQSYFFQNTGTTGFDFILTTVPVGGSFSGQILSGCLTGLLLDTTAATYSQLQPSGFLDSGVMMFTPGTGTPDWIYYQSANNTYMGWSIRVVDDNPWEVFASGAVGQQGPIGPVGPAGLAFEWQGNWSPTAFYNAYDAVFYQGSSWGTTQSVNSLPPTLESPAWVLLAQGGTDGAQGPQGEAGLAFVWLGGWDTDTIYYPNQAVYYNGSSYVCNTTNSGSAPATNQAIWEIVAKSGSQGPQGTQGLPGLGFNFLGDWSNAITYFSGQSVYYQGSTYGTNLTVSGTPPDLEDPWFLLAQRGGTPFSWRGNWNASTQYYAGDSVFFSGQSYATYAQASGTGAYPSNGGTWFVTAAQGGTGPQGASGLAGPGIRWRGGFLTGWYYYSGDAVAYNGNSYFCTATTIGVYPQGGDDTSPWDLMAQQGSCFLFNWKGNWNGALNYSGNDSVYYNGNSYATEIEVDASSSFVPGVSGPWFVVAGQGGQGVQGNGFEINWSGLYNSGTGYAAGAGVYYSGSGYLATANVAANMLPAPTGYPWIHLNSNLQIEHYQANFFKAYPAATNTMDESFVIRPVTFTGMAIGTSVTGSGISGSIYTRDLNGNTTNIAYFTLPSGAFSTVIGGYNYNVPCFYRIGVSLTNVMSSYPSLSVGAFGFYY